MTKHASYVVGLEQVDANQVDLVGGKGAHLGELSRIEGIRVPPGFCVTTAAFERMMAQAAPPLAELLERLARAGASDRDGQSRVSGELRRRIEAIAMPEDVAVAIRGALAGLGHDVACAVRSSATAEDMPTASFAGQLDSYLNVVEPAAILDHVRRCWASMFTDRAVSYRLHKGFDHRAVRLAVVVQRMVPADAAGVLFTADPISGNRKLASVEAVLGLGEGLVSGRVRPHSYQVRGTQVIAASAAQERRVLTDAQLVRLAELGRRIQAHFGCPQDIEWCLTGDEFHIVQSRPITTLFPVPANPDGQNRVYISVGHQQMMTDPMKPLGLSFWQLTTPRPMAEAGGRLFVDITQALASPAGRAGLLNMVGRSDPLMADALRTVVERGDFISAAVGDAPGSAPAASPPAPVAIDPAVVPELIARTQASIAALKRDIATRSGSALIDFILDDLAELKQLLFDPQSLRWIMAAIEATWWLNEHLEAWLGEKNAADTLTRSVPHNVTSEMGLALLDVADAIRPHPQVVAFLQLADRDDFLDLLPTLAGGRQAQEAIFAWLESYGMRGTGEIDITRPRFRERPTALVPILLGHIENLEPGESARRFERGRKLAHDKEQDLLGRLRSLPDGNRKAQQTKRNIDVVRTFIGFREYPKFGMVSRYFIYKQALLEEAERLVGAGVLATKEDIFYLGFHELREAVRTSRVDDQLIRERKEAFRSYQALTPPRVLTSEGEMLNGSYHQGQVPDGALVGLPVSAGTVEGRARVILDLARADVQPGDILVTTYTDPSWTPLFVAVEGLITEVGGLMTHGAVIAREYGLPAIVGVEHATRLIRDGQRIRLHGTAGYIELLG